MVGFDAGVEAFVGEHGFWFAFARGGGVGAAFLLGFGVERVGVELAVVQLVVEVVGVRRADFEFVETGKGLPPFAAHIEPARKQGDLVVVVAVDVVVAVRLVFFVRRAAVEMQLAFEVAAIHQVRIHQQIIAVFKGGAVFGVENVRAARVVHMVVADHAVIVVAVAVCRAQIAFFARIRQPQRADVGFVVGIGQAVNRFFQLHARHFVQIGFAAQTLQTQRAAAAQAEGKARCGGAFFAGRIGADEHFAS